MKVLLPVDGSQASLETLTVACRMVDPRSAQVYLLHVMTPIVLEMPTPMLETQPAVAESILNEAHRTLSRCGMQVVRRDAVLHHDPAQAICDYAQQHAVDCIMLGSHGYRGLAHVLLGSVSERVFRQAKQPVVVLRNDPQHSINISHADSLNWELLQ